LGKQGLKQTYDELWGYALLKDAARVIAVSRMEAEQYVGSGVNGGKVETIPHGLDLSAFDKLPARGAFRRRHGLEDQRIILYLGRVHRIKGLDLLVRAFRELTKSTGSLRLVIAGPDAGYLSTLKKLVADLGVSTKVLFTGPIYGQQKLEAYVDADVYVLPSYYEIFSITVLEACACGTPVVVTDTCGLADVVDGRGGVVAPCDEKRLADAVLTILSDDGLRKQLGDGGKRLVREGFGLVRMATDLERVYEQATRGSVQLRG
jgi:glycosyltransferase involved in cell wall biosynthesis